MDASAELYRAYRERADGVVSDGRPLVGLFGDSFPEVLIASTGVMPVNVKAPPLSDAVDGPVSASVAAVVESFMDDFTARFLHRLASGAFDRFALILFAREDVAGLTAYQYGLELRRQGAIPDTGPAFHLWNFIHTDSPEAARFNGIELDRLNKVLHDVTRQATKADDPANSGEMHRKHQALLDSLGQNGEDTFIWRNAGRWMTTDRHIYLLQKLVPAPNPTQLARKIGLVGTACDVTVMHEVCAPFGSISVDLQQFGQLWPPRLDSDDPAEMLKHLARNPLHIRANPAGRFTDALVDALADCDLVIASVDPNDDSFGWELPVLRQRLEKVGTRFVDLGFRPFRPDADWISSAQGTIREALL